MDMYQKRKMRAENKKNNSQESFFKSPHFVFDYDLFKPTNNSLQIKDFLDFISCTILSKNG